jgi:hypothetical protein
LPERYSKYVSEKMEKLFYYLIDKHATNKDVDDLWDKMDEVCQKCVKLKMMMQRSKEGYCIETIEPKDAQPYSKLEYLTEAMGVEDGKGSDASDEISYLLFGGLSKKPLNSEGKRKVLIKAEVILKRN